MTHLGGDVVGMLTALPAWALLLVVFAFPALEASSLIGLVVPGEIAVLFGGVLAHEGRAPLTAVMAAAVLGAVAGDSVGFLLGARLGPALFSRAPAAATAHLERAQGYVRRFGATAVLLGRWAAVLRALVPSVAGASGVPYRRFVAYNVAGGLVWGCAVAFVGYLAGAAYGRAERSLGLAGAAVALALCVAAVVAARRLSRRRRRA